MFMCTLKFDRKTAIFIVLVAALLLIGIVLLAGAAHKAELNTGTTRITTVNSEKARVAYLAQYGWQAETPAVSEETVIIPRTFPDLFESYNELQKQQGFDLSDYCGLEVELYTYQLSGMPDNDTYLARMYVYHGSVIGGDVHSTALDGFMQGLRPTAKT